MLSDALKKTREKYQAELDQAKAKRDAEINEKVAEYKTQLEAEPCHEIDALESMLGNLDELIAKEEASEKVEAPVVEEVAVFEDPEDPAEQETVEEPTAEVIEEPKEEAPIEEKVEEVKKPKFSFFAKKETPVAEKKEEPKVEEPKPQVSRPEARPGIVNIFTPKRR